MGENIISLEAIAEKHFIDIKITKEYLIENGVKLNHTYINGYDLPKALLMDILKYAKSQTLNKGVNASDKWQKIYYDYFLKASQRLFGLDGKSAKTMSNYLKKQFKFNSKGLKQ